MNTEWWSSLTTKEQQAYIKAHPKSKFHKSALDVSNWKKVGNQMGSNEGGIYHDSNKNPWYVKDGRTDDHAKNEITANHLYRAAGVPVLDQHLVHDGKRLGIASPIIRTVDINPNSTKDSKEAQKHFATHAWLANWDSVGEYYDNQARTHKGMTTLDPGGSLIYRAQGAPKGDAFGNKVGEWNSIRQEELNPTSAKIFGNMTDDDLSDSASKVASIPNDTIHNIIVEHGPGSASDKAALINKMIARKADIAKHVKLKANSNFINWWNKLTIDEQKLYIKDHPGTKLKVSAKPIKIAIPKNITSPTPIINAKINKQKLSKDFDKYENEEFIPEDLALQAMFIPDKLEEYEFEKAVKSIKSEAGQRKAVEILKQKPQPSYILDELAPNFRGDILDEVAENIKLKKSKDEPQYDNYYSPQIFLFSKDYKKFILSFINICRIEGDSTAHRRSWVALADYGANANRKFWEGITPLSDSEKIPSKNMAENLKRLHKETQAFLMKKYGFTSIDQLKNHKIDLMRGVRLNITNYAPAVTESWTSDLGTADNFGNTVLKTSIRASAILWTYESIGNNWSEKEVFGKKEYFVLGGGLTEIHLIHHTGKESKIKYEKASNDMVGIPLVYQGDPQLTDALKAGKLASGTDNWMHPKPEDEQPKKIPVEKPLVEKSNDQKHSNSLPDVHFGPPSNSIDWRKAHAKDMEDDDVFRKPPKSVVDLLKVDPGKLFEPKPNHGKVQEPNNRSVVGE